MASSHTKREYKRNDAIFDKQIIIKPTKSTKYRLKIELYPQRTRLLAMVIEPMQHPLTVCSTKANTQ